MGTFRFLSPFPPQSFKALITTVLDYRLSSYFLQKKLLYNAQLLFRGKHDDNDAHANSAHASTALIFGACLLTYKFTHKQNTFQAFPVYSALMSTAGEDDCLTAICVGAADQILSG